MTDRVNQAISKIEQAEQLIRDAADLLRDNREPEPEPEPEMEFNGRWFPKAARVDILDAEIAPMPGTFDVHVTVALDRETSNTVIAHVRCANGKGGRAAPDVTKAVIFQPGGLTTKTVSFSVRGMNSPGNTVAISQPSVPDGAVRGKTSAAVTVVVEPAKPNLPIEDDYEVRPFIPYGDLAYEATGAQCHSTWMDRLAHGRTQVGNAETGFYMERDTPAFEVEGDVVHLHTYRLATPVQHGTPRVEYPFAAAMLTGLQWENGKVRVDPTTSFRYGTIEWVARMPNRKGSWPALWLLSARGRWPQWPFEIDVFEGFYYNPSFPTGVGLSTNLHGGPEGSGRRTFTRSCDRHTLRDFGLEGHLDREFHRFACSVTPDWIIMYVDGIETIRYRNVFISTNGWYPLMNVAVKANPNAKYEDGSGTMTVRSVRIWRAE